MPENIMRIFSLIAALIATLNLSAGVLYDGGQDALIVTDFPESAPCSPWTLYLTDKMNGWNKVAYDKSSGTYTVRAKLIVGDHRGSDTWVRVGDAETLVVKNGLLVSPNFVKGLNPESHVNLAKKLGKNVLVLGDAGDPKIKATLKLGAGAELSIGFIEAMSRALQYGGGLRVYNSRVTAEEDADTARFGGRFIRFPRFSEVVLKNAEISRFKSDIYSLGKQTSVENCVFAKGRGVIIDKIALLGCVFENMEEAIYDYGNVDATLVNCVFRNNTRNFHLRFNYGVNLVDCDIGAPAVPDLLTARRKRDGKTIYPRIRSSRHVVVSVTDAENKAVAGARVTISGGPKPLVLATGANGECPPVLLDERLVEATDTAPKTTPYVYAIAAEKDGKTAALANYCPRKDNLKIRVALK